MTVRTNGERGNALILSTVLVTLASAIAFAAIGLSLAAREEASEEHSQNSARQLAEAGLAFAEHQVRLAAAKNPWQPLESLDAAFPQDWDGTGAPVGVRVADDRPLVADGIRRGTFTADVWVEIDGTERHAFITATGWYPNAEQPLEKVTLRTIVQFSTQSAEAFRYAYFTHNWGLVHQDNVVFDGNARSNGPFHALDRIVTVNGAPRYAHLDEYGDLIGYFDDNDDGLMSGADGGLYSAWSVDGTGYARGMGSLPENQHSPFPQSPMPNFGRIDHYEAQALDSGATLRLGGQEDEYGNPLPPLRIVEGVLGDDTGEAQHLALFGTPEKPILLNGLVVVRGDVVLGGVVQGQGAILSGRNVYIAQDLVYANGPDTLLPQDNSTRSSETWITTNASKDFLGLYARENVVLGDFTDEAWITAVNGWLNEHADSTIEDTGADQIPFTYAGKDQESGTNDDDALEGDGIWTTLTYSAEDADQGLIPAGFALGDPIPGTGEDVDGDGSWDYAPIALENFAFEAPLIHRELWAGNLPHDVECYCEVTSPMITMVQAAIHSSHAIVGHTVAPGIPLTFFGSVSCVHDGLRPQTGGVRYVHDRRLLGEGLLRRFLPRTLAQVLPLVWKIAQTGDVNTLAARF